MIAAFLLALCSLHLPQSLLAAGQLRQARDAFSLALSCSASDALLTASALTGLASAEQDLFLHNEAELHYRKALVLLESRAPDSPAHAEALNGLGSLYFQLHRLSLAESHTRRALAILTPNDAAKARMLSNLAVTLQAWGKLREAASAYAEALSLLENHKSPEAAFLFSNRGLLHAAERRPLEAIADLETALAIWRKSLPPNHPHLAFGEGNLARVLTLNGRHAAAEPHWRDAVAIAEPAFGPDHRVTGSLYAAWAHTLRRLNRNNESKQAAARARRILNGHPPDPWLTHRADIRALTGGSR